MVLHDLNLASKYSDFLLAMKDGKIEKYGTPKEVFDKEMLANCFQIDGEIIIDKNSEKPLCVSYELLSFLLARIPKSKIILNMIFLMSNTPKI